MLYFPTRNLFIEGPDCSGKTTLIRNIHSFTGYKWHIHDRSQVSRSIFCEMYSRNLQNINDDYHAEVFNLNNRFIFLLPNFEIIEKRFEKRGDDIHKDVSQIRSVYDAFNRELLKISSLPNVIPCLSIATPRTVEALASVISLVEKPLLREVSDQVEKAVRQSGGECFPLSFTLYDDGKFEEASPESMLHKPEEEYYDKIYKSLHEKISNELLGKNEYNRVESVASRRFVHTDDSCISFIQVSIRDRMMDFHTVIRSSDVRDIFPHDLKFLYYLSSTCYKRFEDHCDSIRLRFNLNSAHII